MGKTEIMILSLIQMAVSIGSVSVDSTNCGSKISLKCYIVADMNYVVRPKIAVLY